MVSEFPAGYHN
ncbi:hypothetical protein CGCTS75_v000336 [Colletotrichum tropicale]|nr:hypothetical protein CGCTS75_v000336 [Colletotrichum tropicale]